MSDVTGSSSGRYRVLLVEDSPPMLLVLEAWFKQAGCGVLAAPDAQTALAGVVQQTPDAAVIDYRLPGMDGLELCERLLADAQTANVPVILVSAADAATLKQLPARANIVAIARKPFSVGGLVEQVLSLMQHHRSKC